MRKSVRLAEKETKSRKGSREETKANKSRSNNRITPIVTMDSDTILEVFKCLNYYQLANNSLVSKRFWNLIRTNRHSLSLLCVEEICNYGPLSAFIRGRASIELNYENSARLLTDPFIYICSISFIYEIDDLNLLAAAIGPDRRLRCEEIYINSDFEVFQDFMEWINGHVRCDKFTLEDYDDQNQDPTLLNFFLTGAQCTSSITVRHQDWSEDLSETFVNFVQHFMDHNKCDDFQFVKSIKSDLIVAGHVIDELEIRYPKCIVEKETDDVSTTYVFELNNCDIGKKLQVTVVDGQTLWYYRLFMKIEDL